MGGWKLVVNIISITLPYPITEYTIEIREIGLF